MKTQLNFPEIFSRNFPAKFSSEYSEKFFSLFQDKNEENFPQSFVEGAVQNFNMAVKVLGEKTKEVEQDIRKRWCDYPSA